MAKPQSPNKNKVPRVSKWLEPSKPEYVKLEVGEEISGLYLGRQFSQYGPVYRFQNGDKIIALNGNRAQLDSLMDQADAAGWKGKLLVIQRIKDQSSNQGRTVHQYRIGLLDDNVPF